MNDIDSIFMHIKTFHLKLKLQFNEQLALMGFISWPQINVNSIWTHSNFQLPVFNTFVTIGKKLWGNIVLHCKRWNWKIFTLKILNFQKKLQSCFYFYYYLFNEILSIHHWKVVRVKLIKSILTITAINRYYNGLKNIKVMNFRLFMIKYIYIYDVTIYT